MDLEKILTLISTNSPITIQYSNINGEEKLIVNGEDVSADYDDTEIKNKIKNYKQVIELIDDCMFVEILKDVKDIIDIKELDTLTKKESFTKEEGERVSALLDMVGTVINEHVTNKIQDLQEIIIKL